MPAIAVRSKSWDESQHSKFRASCVRIANGSEIAWRPENRIPPIAARSKSWDESQHSKLNSKFAKKALLPLTTSACIPIFLRPAFNVGLTRWLATKKSLTN